MSRESTSLRAVTVSIVHGWLCLLAFALAATMIGAKPQPDAPPVLKTIVAPAQLGANGAATLRAVQHDRGHTPGLITKP
jgi:ABC-type transport system involved in cytochrome c biogenesis permease subunit